MSILFTAINIGTCSIQQPFIDIQYFISYYNTKKCKKIFKKINFILNEKLVLKNKYKIN